MKIDGFKIGGFANIDLVNLDVEGMNALVAPNGYGKSNVLHGIEFGVRFFGAEEAERRQMMGSRWKPVNTTIDGKNFSFEIRGSVDVDGEEQLFVYSPSMNVDAAGYMERYPGDEIIDILGLDGYTYKEEERGIEVACADFRDLLKATLDYMVPLAKQHGKIIALSETGLEGICAPTWWTEALYPAIKDYPVAYALTWRNACDKPEHFYGPWKGFEYEDDFKAFAENDQIVLL